MKQSIRLAIIGDYSSAVTAHTAIPHAIELAADGRAVETTWIATPALEQAAEQTLASYDAIWCVPGSPYASMIGALNAIRFARETGRPFLGTCGGCQHALIEYARNVLGIHAADHAENNPDADIALVAPLACALREVSDTIVLRPGTRIHAIYGSDTISEGYNCSFGLNPQYRALLEDGRLHIGGADEAGDARTFELDGHPFFIATLFQPERTALRGLRSPLIAAYLEAAFAGGAQ